MELNSKEIIASEKGNFYLVISRERDIDTFVSQVTTRSENTIIKIIRGIRCGTSEALNQEFGAALQLPYYSVGDNWSGFDDTINDLEFDSKVKLNYLIFITNFNKVLSDSPRDLEIFLDILKDTIPNLAKEKRNNISDRQPITLNIFFHCESEHEDKCKEILKKENINPLLLTLKPFDHIR